MGILDGLWFKLGMLIAEFIWGVAIILGILIIWIAIMLILEACNGSRK